MELWRGPSGGVPNNVYGPEAFVNQWVAKTFGLAVSVRFARENALTEFTLMRTTRNLPDMFIVPNVQVFSETARTGVLKALEDYYDDPNYPHLQKIPRVHLAFMTLEGHQYGIPIRYDHDLDNPSREVVPWLLMPRSLPGRLGMDAPETLDDLLAAMQAVRDGDLTSWTGQPMIPMGLGEAEPRWLITFGDRIFGAPGADTRNVGNLQAMALHLDDGGRVPSWGSVERREGAAGEPPVARRSAGPRSVHAEGRRGRQQARQRQAGVLVRPLGRGVRVRHHRATPTCPTRRRRRGTPNMRPPSFR